MIRGRALAVAFSLAAFPLAADPLPNEVLYQMMPEPLEGWQISDVPDVVDIEELWQGGVAVRDYAGPNAETFRLMIQHEGRFTANLLRQFDQPDALAELGEVMEIDDFPVLHNHSAQTVVARVGTLLIQATGAEDPFLVNAHLETMDLSEMAAAAAPD